MGGRGGRGGVKWHVKGHGVYLARRNIQIRSQPLAHVERGVILNLEDLLEEIER